MIKVRNMVFALSMLTFAIPNIVNAEEHVVNAAAREFKPAIVYVQPGDTVKFINMTSHNAVTNLVPDGGVNFGEKGKMAGATMVTPPLETNGIFG